MSGIPRLLWRPLNELAERERRPLRVLDIASGAGDIVLALDRIARRRGRNIQFSACDLSPRAVAFGRRQAEQSGANVQFFEHDALKGALPTGYDAITCSLFLHHLTEAEASDLLGANGGRRELPSGRLRFGSFDFGLVGDLRRYPVVDAFPCCPRRRSTVDPGRVHDRRSAATCPQGWLEGMEFASRLAVPIRPYNLEKCSPRPCYDASRSKPLSFRLTFLPMCGKQSSSARARQVLSPRANWRTRAYRSC